MAAVLDEYRFVIHVWPRRCLLVMKARRPGTKAPSAVRVATVLPGHNDKTASSVRTCPLFEHAAGHAHPCLLSTPQGKVFANHATLWIHGGTAAIPYTVVLFLPKLAYFDSLQDERGRTSRATPKGHASTSCASVSTGTVATAPQATALSARSVTCCPSARWRSSRPSKSAAPASWSSRQPTQLSQTPSPSETWRRPEPPSRRLPTPRL